MMDSLPKDSTTTRKAPTKRTRTKEGLAVGLFLMGLVVAIWLGQDETDRSSTNPPRTHLACPLLAEAARHREASDERAFSLAVAEAAAVAEHALDTSGEQFGTPEEIALNLGALSDEPDDALVGRLLERAREACRGKASWPPVAATI
jgi:hypothetical protein